MHVRLVVLSLAVAAATVVIRAQAADACGGCFAPPETVTSVDSHRMVISLSPEQTTLWDQIRYTGDPEDFVWVLPVPSSEATIEVADGLFFDELESFTAPQISAPPLPPGPSCPPPPDGWGGFGGQDAAPSSDAGVDVYREEVVGPYQTVVIGSESADALVDWLNDNDYLVPDATLPTIQHYIDNDSVFIVLRLAPDQGVSAMQPVRVQYPGYMSTFPLKMVTVGAYGTLALTLWVIAEQRYDAINYGTVQIDPSELVWDFWTNSSNYSELFRAAIDANGGKAWVAEYADSLANLWFSDVSEVEIASQNIPYPYLTRLRTEQLLEHLSEDLVLGPAADASSISRFLQAPNGVNFPPPPTCPDWDDDGEPDTWEDYNDSQRTRGWWSSGCTTGGGAGGGAAIALLGFAIALAVRRWTR